MVIKFWTERSWKKRSYLVKFYCACVSVCEACKDSPLLDDLFGNDSEHSVKALMECDNGEIV